MRKSLELSDATSCLNKAGDDELVFVLLSRDPAAVATVEFWIAKRIELGIDAPDSDKLKEAAQLAHQMQVDCLPFVVNDRIQGLDCSFCEDGISHIHEPIVEAQGSGSERYGEGDPYKFEEYLRDSPHAKALNNA